MQQEISEMHSSVPSTGKRTSEHDHSFLVLNHTWFKFASGFCESSTSDPKFLINKHDSPWLQVIIGSECVLMHEEAVTSDIAMVEICQYLGWDKLSVNVVENPCLC